MNGVSIVYIQWYIYCNSTIYIYRYPGFVLYLLHRKSTMNGGFIGKLTYQWQLPNGDRLLIMILYQKISIFYLYTYHSNQYNDLYTLYVIYIYIIYIQ